MRIVHVVSSLEIGGMEQFVVRIALAQREAGHDAAIFALHSGPLHERAVKAGLRVVTPGEVGKALRIVKAGGQLARLRPDILHAHNATALHYATLGKRVSGAKVVLTCHGQGLGPVRTPSRLEWERTDAVVAVSSDTAQTVSARAGDDAEVIASRLSVIHNGVAFHSPTMSRREMRERLKIPEKHVVGVMVARVDGRKGHDTLLDALAILQSRSVPVTVLVVGDGEARAECEQKAQALQLGPDVVRFLGFRDDVPNILYAGDFFTLPSLAEGLPLSVLEAMAQSLPVVASRVGGIPELITDSETGILVPPADADALAKAIAQIAERPKWRAAMGRAGRERAETAFSFAGMTARYNALYSRLLAAKTRSRHREGSRVEQPLPVPARADTRHV